MAEDRGARDTGVPLGGQADPADAAAPFLDGYDAAQFLTEGAAVLAQVNPELAGVLMNFQGEVAGAVELGDPDAEAIGNWQMLACTVRLLATALGISHQANLDLAAQRDDWALRADTGKLL